VVWQARPSPTTLHPLSPTVKPEVPSAVYAPDDGRGDARNMLSHT